MICTIDVRCNAANPNLPIKQFVSFKDSPSSIRVLDVPKKIGKWNITSVFVQVKYPDDTTVSKECVRNGNVWVGTVEGTSTTGISKNGFSIIANGWDENGELVESYVLGVGDVLIMEMDGTISPNEKSWSIHFYDSIPDNPKTGDAYLDGIALMIYDGSDWVKIGDQDLSGYVKIGSNQISQDQTISFINNNDTIERKSDRIKVAKQGGGTTLTHNLIQMIPQYGSSQILVGDSMYGGVVRIGDNAIVLQGDSLTSSIKLNGNKVLTEVDVVPDTNNTGYAANASYALNSVMAQQAQHSSSATKAEQDGNGNNIASTYATKTYVDQQIGNVLTQEEF